MYLGILDNVFTTMFFDSLNALEHVGNIIFSFYIIDAEVFVWMKLLECFLVIIKLYNNWIVSNLCVRFFETPHVREEHNKILVIPSI